MSKQQCQNKKCYFKYDHQTYSHCPICGTRTPEGGEEGVQGWNSTLKQYKSNRLSPRSDKRSSTNNEGRTELQQAMRQVAQDWTIESLDRYGAVLCSNCGKDIGQVRFHNVSHIKSRAKHPELMYDPDNMEVLCASINFMGEKDNSCHTAWEQDRDYYYERTNKHRTIND